MPLEIRSNTKKSRQKQTITKHTINTSTFQKSLTPLVSLSFMLLPQLQHLCPRPTNFTNHPSPHQLIRFTSNRLFPPKIIHTTKAPTTLHPKLTNMLPLTLPKPRNRWRLFLLLQHLNHPLTGQPQPKIFSMLRKKHHSTIPKLSISLIAVDIKQPTKQEFRLMRRQAWLESRKRSSV